MGQVALLAAIAGGVAKTLFSGDVSLNKNIIRDQGRRARGIFKETGAKIGLTEGASAKALRKRQEALVAQQKKVQGEEQARLSQEEAVQNRREASRTRTLRGRLRRGRGVTLFGGQTGVTTSQLGGGS